MEGTKKLQQIISESSNIVFFGGVSLISEVWTAFITSSGSIRRRPF